MTMKVALSSAAIFSGFLIAACLFTTWQASRIAAAFPPKGAYVEVEGARIHFTQTLPKSEPAGDIILIHGASGNEADMRVPLGERLAAQGFRVVSVDRPGHGWSTRDAIESTPARQALQIRQALEKIGVKRAIIAGHSLAGVMTLQLALDHTDIVEGVVLIAPVTHPWPGGVAGYYYLTTAPMIGGAFTNTFMMPTALSIFDRSLAHVFSPQTPPENYRGLSGVELVLRPETFRANARDVVGIYDFVEKEQIRYKNISIPVSIITGDQDAIVLTHIHSYGSARDIPGSQLQIMKGIGHSPHWARPDDVSTRIAEFAANVHAGR